ncbi:MAG: hypothetical protein DRR08_29760 [Candidatus Parabeggiatoa sp. nov. 2]|nr:MAG: hypothetical protein DRR08_29760 [Gammaproteobacteria bacterium]
MDAFKLNYGPQSRFIISTFCWQGVQTLVWQSSTRSPNFSLAIQVKTARLLLAVSLRFNKSKTALKLQSQSFAPNYDGKNAQH